jgi:hypothetical protein
MWIVRMELEIEIGRKEENWAGEAHEGQFLVEGV